MADEIEVIAWNKKRWVKCLRDYIMGDNPHPVAILAASEVLKMEKYSWDVTDEAPDWLYSLANGSPDPELWDDVIQVVRDLIRYDEKREAK